MLVSSFKSAEELGLTLTGHRKLIAILHMMEAGELADSPTPTSMGFTMGQYWQEGPRGKSTGCISGWWNHMEPRQENNIQPGTSMQALFEPPGYSTGQYSMAQAAHALRTYLVTGTPDWGN